MSEIHRIESSYFSTETYINPHIFWISLVDTEGETFIRNALEMLASKDPSLTYKQQRAARRVIELKTLSLQFFGNSIQDGEHCSLEDAKAAMQLYALKKEEFDASVESNAQRVPPPRPRISFDLPCQIW